MDDVEELEFWEDTQAPCPGQDSAKVDSVAGCYEYNVLHPLTPEPEAAGGVHAECSSDSDTRKQFRDRCCTLWKQWSSDAHLSSRNHLRKAAVKGRDSAGLGSVKAEASEQVEDDMYKQEEFRPPAPADFDGQKR